MLNIKHFLDTSNSLTAQLVRYGLVVAVAFPIDFGLLYLFVSKLGVYYIIGATLAFSISMAVNYLLSVTWVFKNQHNRSHYTNATIFAIIGFIGLGLTDVFMWLFTSVFGLYYLSSKLVAVTIVFFWSFGARRYLFQGWQSK